MRRKVQEIRRTGIKNLIQGAQQVLEGVKLALIDFEANSMVMVLKFKESNEMKVLSSTIEYAMDIK